ncbi:MAG TPA: ATP-grasp domain-containing protein [Abditibacterium sp.]|jgi:hypothetical protein
MILFPADSLQKSQVETDYQVEWDGAKAANFEVAIFDFDELLRGESARQILRFLPREAEIQNVILRSWMLSVENYGRLETMLIERGFSLLTSANNYEFAHHFPGFYPFLENYTPRSITIPLAEFKQGDNLDFAPIAARLQSFGDAPLVVKDWVKSQKHRWHEACFIPRASDLVSAEKVVRRFLELQGEFLTGGVVLRAFLELKSVGTHPKSGLPLTAEWRVFVLDGKPFFTAPYWDGADYGTLKLDLDFVRERAKTIPARFFSLDVAQTIDDEWKVIEIGDGQVSGLPSVQFASEFFSALRKIAPRNL